MVCGSDRAVRYSGWGRIPVRYPDTSGTRPAWRRWVPRSKLLGAAGQNQIAYTDAKGFFTLSGLLPGSYDVRVSAPSFLPALREDVALAAGASKVLNITLNTLFEAVRMLPALKQGNDEDDSWKWTLRSNANRPILRFDDGTPVVVETAAQDQSMNGDAGVHGWRLQSRVRQPVRFGHGLQRRAFDVPYLDHRPGRKSGIRDGHA